MAAQDTVKTTTNTEAPVVEKAIVEKKESNCQESRG